MKIKKNDMLIYIVFYWLLLQNAIISTTRGLINTITGYIDELVTIYCIIYVLLNILSNKKLFEKLERQLLICCVSIIILGTFSSLINERRTILIMLVDLLTCVKFFFTFFAFSIIWRKRRNRYKIVNGRNDFILNINFLVRVIVVITFILDIFNIFVAQIFPVGKYRLFMHSQVLFFDRPADLAILMLLCIILLMYNLKYKTTNIPYLIMASFVCISTMRYKEIAIVIFVWILYLIYCVFKSKKKSRVILFIGAVAIVILFGYDQFMNYYGEEGTARALLLKNSIVLANTYFPLGAGFGTYGSFMARRYYSPLYYQFGYNTIYGMNQQYAGYLTDTFFPIVLGQFGWIALVIMVISFILLFLRIRKIRNRYNLICSLSIIGYLVVNALGASSLFNPLSVLVAIILSEMIYCSDI